MGDGLAFRPCVGLGDGEEPAVEGSDLGGGGRRDRVAGGGFEFGLLAAERFGLVAKLAYAFAEHVLGDGAVLEGEHVTVDGGLGSGQFGFDGAKLLGVLACCGGGLVAVGGGGVDEDGRVGVEVDEGVEHGGLQGVGPDALSLAGGSPVAGAGPAHVIAVAVGLASGGGADVATLAVAAGDEPGEQVLGVGVGVAALVAFAALVEEGLHVVEEGGVDEGVGAVVPGAAEVDLADVAAVAEDAEDDLGGPGLAGPGAQPVGVQLGGDGGRAAMGFGVAVEDPLDDGELGRLDGRSAFVFGFAVGVFDNGEPVGSPPRGPASAGSLAFHAGDDAVDDRGPLELCEHTEELHEHAPGGGGGVDGLGGRPERHAGLVEFLEATDYRRSESAGRALASFVEDVQQGHDYRTTLIGHSYGSLVAAHAVAYGLHVDNFVAIGSPGLGIVDQRELDAFYSNSSHLYAARTPGDPYAGSGGAWYAPIVENFYALDPYDTANGFALFQTNLRGLPYVHGHDAYFARGSESLANMADIVTGNYSAVSTYGG
ncbi:MAG: hypothetical protein JOZ41_22725 [Chloroflexi bacterium]|nr:hypothetical protein [Chloroflexota bacterium]